MSRRPRVAAIAAQMYRAEGEFPCALYDGESDCVGMTNQKNYCHGCKAYVCSQCDQVDVEGDHQPSDHKKI